MREKNEGGSRFRWAAQPHHPAGRRVGINLVIHRFKHKQPLKNEKVCRMGSPRANCRSEEHTSELQSLMRISYAVFCLKKKKKKQNKIKTNQSKSTRNNHSEK